MPDLKARLPNLSRQSGVLSVVLSLLVLGVCLAYTAEAVFDAPYPGLDWGSDWTVNGVESCEANLAWCEANRNTLELGDQLLAIGNLTYDTYGRDRTSVPFEGAQPGEFVTVTFRRAGEAHTVQWQVLGPTLASRLNRLAALLVYFPLWLAGTVTLFLVRPHDLRWRLLVAFNYLTAVWVTAGVISALHVAYASPVVHALSWLLVPNYLRLHLTIPRPIGPRYLRFFIPPLHALAALLAVLELLRVLPSSLFHVALLLATLGSLGVLVWRLRTPLSASDRIATRLMCAGIGLAFGPGLLLAAVPGSLQVSTGFLGTLIANLSVGLLPFFYMYAIYRRRLGNLEFRANRLLSFCSFALLYVTLSLLAFSLGGQWLPGATQSVTFSLVLSVVFAVAALPLSARFQRLFDRLAYGARYTADEILHVFADRIQTTLEREALTRLLTRELLPSLLIRESALYLAEDSEFTLLYAAGIHLDSSARPLPALAPFFEKSGQLLPAPAKADDPWAWVQLALALRVRDTTTGIWLFGRRDPDDVYSRSDILLLGALANQVATAIENMRLFEETNRRLVQLETVNRVSKDLRIAQTLEEMLPLLLDETLAVLGASAASLWLYDAERDEMRRAAQRESPGTMLARRPDEDMVRRVLATGQPCVNGTSAAVPLREGEKTTGALQVSVPASPDLTPERVALLTTIGEIAAIAIHRTRLREQTERRLHQVQALHAIDLAIASNKDLRTTLDIFLGHVTAQMQAEAAAILLVNAPALTLEYAAVRGLSQSIGGASLRIGEGYAGWVVRECRPLLIRNLAAPEVPSADAQELLSRGFISYYAAPLLVGGQTRGVLEIFHRAPFDPDAERLEFLQSLIAQAAIAIDQADLLDHLRHSSLDLALAYDATIEGWSRALDLRDQETEGHSRRMTEVTLKLARALGVPEDDLPHIRRGVLLHDIGKMAIPDSILLKPGPLTDAEWDIMRQHPVYAYQLLSPVDYLRPALDIPYCHHEKWDGTGYPRGLKGEQIPLAARLFAVVDVWDALSSDRPYRRAWPPERVLEYLACQAGKHFDPRVLETFLKLTYGRSTAPQDNANLHESALTQTLSW